MPQSDRFTLDSKYLFILGQGVPPRQPRVSLGLPYRQARGTLNPKCHRNRTIRTPAGVDRNLSLPVGSQTSEQSSCFAPQIPRTQARVPQGVIAETRRSPICKSGDSSVWIEFLPGATKPFNLSRPISWQISPDSQIIISFWPDHQPTSRPRPVRPHFPFSASGSEGWETSPTSSLWWCHSRIS
jgi:hypothetical protein